MKSLSIVFDVLPFYLTWFILIIVFLREDRRKAKLIIAFGCIAMGIFEGYTQMNYGDPDHMHRFELVKSIFAENFTMKDILQFLRSLFPLFFQLIIFILDYTLDSVDTMKA
jgi:hypothetical protein